MDNKLRKLSGDIKECKKIIAGNTAKRTKYYKHISNKILRRQSKQIISEYL